MDSISLDLIFGRNEEAQNGYFLLCLCCNINCNDCWVWFSVGDVLRSARHGAKSTEIMAFLPALVSVRIGNIFIPYRYRVNNLLTSLLLLF